jgi:amylovoran biosynthesis protein AmsF
MPSKSSTNSSEELSIYDQANGNTLTVLGKDGKTMDFGKIVLELATVSGGNTAVTTVGTIDALRALEPTTPGELAIVMEYTAGTKTGGGVFIYDKTDTRTAEDYGINIVTPKGARWKRNLTNFREVNVIFFGAVPGGTIDSAEAVTRMWNWSQAHSPSIGIQFPAGRYLMSKFDIQGKEVARFRLAGDLVTFGYSPATTLISDKKNGEVMFNVNARYTEITSIIVDGESKAATPNTKGFYKNIIQAGQFIRVSNMMFYNLGGKGLSMLDTLDCKIDQWYARDCSDTVIYATWSNNPSGKWDHITAIELSNFNIQRSTAKPAIDLQRATQSFIWNGWIEHSEYPGNLSNGDWSFIGFNLETCTHPFECHYTRFINTQFNLQAGSSMDTSETGDTWSSISAYEKGNVHTESHGIEINGSLSYDYLSSPNKMDNRKDAETWFYLGELAPSQNTVQTRIRLLASCGYSSQGETQTGYSERSPEGSADIFILKTGDNSFTSSWVGQGSSPATRVLTQPGSSNGKIKIYVKLGKYTGYTTAIIETNDFSRFSKGIRFMFEKSYTAVTDATMLATLNGAADNCFHQHWHGKAAVGIGFNNDNALLLKSASVATADVGTDVKYLKVMVDGTAYALELKKLKPAS